MEESADSRIDKTSNLVSRNRPVALIVNACTLLGSFLAKRLLEKSIQVVALDDFSIADKSRVESVSKDKDLHLVNLAIDHDTSVGRIQDLNLARLDYAFFISSQEIPDAILGQGVINFINVASLLKQEASGSEGRKLLDRPKLAFVSSINLYGRSLSTKDRVIRESEEKFAKGVKHFKLNGRVVRLAELFGPGMELDSASPLSRLILAFLNDKLEDEKISLDFSERGLFIEDAALLVEKSVLSGSTANKIYDGALLNPIRLSEIKQILSSPVWSGENPPALTKLPSWPTPNLVKTMKELSWSPKTPLVEALKKTTAYFKERPDLIPKSEPAKLNFKPEKSWSFSGSGFLNKDEDKDKDKKRETGEESKGEEKENKDRSSFDSELKKEKDKSLAGRSKKTLVFLVLAGIIGYGLIWPFIYLGYQVLSIRNHLVVSRAYLEEGNFDRAEGEIKTAQAGLAKYKEIFDGAGILKKIPKVSDGMRKGEEILDITSEGVDGALYATQGSRSLFETTKIISGESREDPGKYYEKAERDLGFAAVKLSKVYANLGDPALKQGMPDFISNRIDDLKTKVGFYQSLVEQTRAASKLMPKITGLEGKKSYLVLLENNLELRPTGGFIGSYARLDFDNGRLANIKVDDIYSLDGALKEVITPPPDLKADLNLERLYLRDSNFDPDFPTSARQAEFFYRKEAGESVHGVIAMDLKASGYLLDAVGGLELPEYGESVTGDNLFEKSVSHAETNFFPGSQAKKNYLTSLQTQLFNKIFYLSKQNWPAIVQALSKSLKEKHILIYLEDPSLFSYLSSSNWSGVFPRQAENREGESRDFLAVIESNMGANKANYFLQRKYTLDSAFTKEGKIMHKLKIAYKNTSPSEVFPAGIYKNRIKVYTPLGSKLTRALLGETDITKQFIGFSDYGRSAFSSLIQIAPKEAKTLILEYELAEPLMFRDNLSVYRMEIFKQPGTMSDPLDYALTYPINFKLEEKPGEGSSGVQEVKIKTDMQTDRVFQFKVKK